MLHQQIQTKNQTFQHNENMKRSNVNKFHRERVRSRAGGCNLNKSKLDLQNENTSRG